MQVKSFAGKIIDHYPTYLYSKMKHRAAFSNDSAVIKINILWKRRLPKLRKEAS